MLPSAEFTWTPLVGERPTAELAPIVARLLRSSVLPKYTEVHPTDRRPLRAIEAAEAYWKAPSEPRALRAAAVAKACTEARKDTLGGVHRVAEAARALALSATRSSDRARRLDLFEALHTAESELLYREMCAGRHGREAEVRAQLAALLRE